MDQDKMVSQVLSSAGSSSAQLDVVVDTGPRKALAKLQLEKMSITENRVWLESARIEAVLGSCRRSLPSVRYELVSSL